MHVLIAGSSGLIGTALRHHLTTRGHRITRLVRRQAAPGEIRWDPARGELPGHALDGVDAVVNLAGAGIGDHRWTDSYRRTLLASRLDTTGLLAASIAAAAAPPAVFVSGSAIGYYGPRGDERLEEDAPPGTDFLARLCVRWEAAAGPAADAGVRCVQIRSGMVLSPRGGALKRLLPLFRLGLGGRFGSGRQWQSWISIDDHVRAIEHLVRTSSVHGPVNLVAPEPVTNIELTRTLARVLRRPAVLPIPAFGPRLVVGRELADALLLTGQRVVPARLTGSGFRFLHSSLEPALRELLHR